MVNGDTQYENLSLYKHNHLIFFQKSETIMRL